MKTKHPLYIVIILALFLCINACGNTSVTFGESDVDFDGESTSSGDSGTSTDEATNDGSCDDTGASLTEGSISVAVYGEACNAPSPSASTVTDGEILLGCGSPSPGRTASSLDTDYVRVTCGDATEDYYCSSGVTYRNDSGSGTQLYETISIECVTDGEGSSSLSEEEFTIS